MADQYDFDLDPVTFITVGTRGPAGQRTFYLQAAQKRRVVSLVIEKDHAIGLSVNLMRLIEDVSSHAPEGTGAIEPEPGSMALIEPLDAAFRVDNIGIGVDEAARRVILIAHELVEPDTPARQARFVASYHQILGLARHAAEVVQQGRPTCPLCGEPIDADGHFCPPRNGHARAPG